MSAAATRLLLPDDRLKRSLVALKRGPVASDFDAVVSALKQEYAHYSTLCQSHGDPVQLYRAQGAAVLLDNILKVIEEAGK